MKLKWHSTLSQITLPIIPCQDILSFMSCQDIVSIMLRCHDALSLTSCQHILSLMSCPHISSLCHNNTYHVSTDCHCVHVTPRTLAVIHFLSTHTVSSVMSAVSCQQTMTHRVVNICCIALPSLCTATGSHREGGGPVPSTSSCSRCSHSTGELPLSSPPSTKPRCPSMG